MSNSTAEIRQAFLDFFHSKGHQVVESSSLVPDNDSTLLFTNAGMNQFKDVFLGLDSRSYRRATTSQRCVRAGGKHNDLEKVGYTARHHTFFEMLGNFSFGDYCKYDAIGFAWECLTSKQWFNLPKENLWVTVYATDDETYNIWTKEIGVSTERIIYIGDNKGRAYASDNFWQMGDTGPCGPCSEIFYDQGEHILGSPPGISENDGDRYIEIWNLVFMQFNRQSDGTMLPLPKISVDTGMGLERIASVLQHVNSNYDIDLFKQLIDATAQVTSARNPDSKYLQVIADHIRSCSFLVSDGVMPSNEGRGYVLRRIIRRAIRHGKMLGVDAPFFYKLVAPLIAVMGSVARQLNQQQHMVEQVLRAEEDQFANTLERGLSLLEEELYKMTGDTLDGKTAFRLYDTYGFPLDLTVDVCRERNIRIDQVGFEHAMTAQRKRARALSGFGSDYNNLLLIAETTRFLGYEQLEHHGQVTAICRYGQPVDVIYKDNEAMVVIDATPFYGESGGQVGDIGVLKSSSGLFEVTHTQKYGKMLGHLGTLRYGELKLGTQVAAKVDKIHRMRVSLNHSATHLLHAALRQVLGEHVRQKGSLVNNKVLRFDFSYKDPMRPEQVRLVEDIVNKQIRRNLPIHTDIMALEDARNKGAMALFDAKYETQVRVLRMGDFSIELCGGTHASRTGDIGLFCITSESGTASGIRRIQAVTGEEALALLHRQRDQMHQVAKLVKGNNQTVVDKVRALQAHSRQLEKSLQQLKSQQAAQEIATLGRNVRYISGVKVLVCHLKNADPKMLSIMVKDLKNQLGSAVIVLATEVRGKVSLIAGVTKDLTNRVKASDIVDHLSQQVGGKGGGHPDLASAGGGDTASLPIALKSVDTLLAARL
ncbi:alanine--tRNA ligase [Sodalis endosymbiont of Henestaris halophilus]|uniref:alanine--tRNA ligase n=1 Tax=Sodalis endosymbiont of Henestaris halophilus TaxID=1929246 RepID=UPI000BC01F06|nr:alanine--tRNA ligase [Sodalis endosymbiont of Henestaris halophilus]SNC58907.1 Alanine--tRNA ligase [Sodalis endosymbiont of Henestaris halophilus]